MPGFTLYKLSSPGFTKHFGTKRDLLKELKTHICKDCLDGRQDYIDENGQIVLETVCEPLHDSKSIGDLLWTACGCEYSVEKCWGYKTLKRNGFK